MFLNPKNPYIIPTERGALYNKMGKNTDIFSVSIPKEMSNFLAEHENISLSEEIQGRLREIIKNHELFNSESAKLRKNIESLQKEIGLLHHFIENNGLFEKFFAFRRATIENVLEQEKRTQ